MNKQKSRNTKKYKLNFGNPKGKFTTSVLYHLTLAE